MLKKYSRPIVLILIFALIFLLNYFTLYTSDDFAYHFFYQGEFPTEQLKNISNLSDLVQSQINH